MREREREREKGQERKYGGRGKNIITVVLIN